MLDLGTEWPGSRLSPLNLKEIPPDIHYIGGWVHPRVDLDIIENRGSSFPCQE
jgi:hypothetical protein